MALWVERTHGDQGPHFIGERIDALAQSGEEEGVRLWRAVGRRFECLADKQKDERSS
ncbi:DUF6961 family protein [Tsuneonella sp. HG094]